MLGPGQRQVRMIVRVVPNFVTFVDDSPNESRIFFRVRTNQEKCGLRVCRFQNIQNFRRPLRIRAIVKSNRDLMLAARTLVIQRRELGKLCVFGGEITFRIDRELSHSVGATFIDGHDLPFTHVGDCVGAFQNFECFARLIVDLEIFRNSQRVPDRWIFGPETIERESARFLSAHFAELVQERDDIEKPNGVFFIGVLKIKIRIITGPAHLCRFYVRVERATHRFWKTDQLRFLAANRPIVPVTPKRNDPLLGIGLFQQNVKPTFKP